MALHPQLDEMIQSMVPFVQQFHAKGQLAPHAASMDLDGNIIGAALTSSNDSQQISVDGAIRHFEEKFRQEAGQKKILASAIFYHGIGMPAGSPTVPATSSDDAFNLVARLEHCAGDAVHLVIPYMKAADGISYERGYLLQKELAVFPAMEVVPEVVNPEKAWWRFW